MVFSNLVYIFFIENFSSELTKKAYKKNYMINYFPFFRIPQNHQKHIVVYLGGGEPVQAPSAQVAVWLPHHQEF